MSPFRPTSLAAWPADRPLIMLAGTGRHAFVAADPVEIPWAEAARTPLLPRSPVLRAGPPFQSGLMGFIPYDLFTDPPGPARPRVFRIGAGGVLGGNAPTGSLGAAPPEELNPRPLSLRPDSSNEAYESLVKQALTDIRAGRYYQINLLRYFKAQGDIDLPWLLARLEKWGGPYTALFKLPDLTIASFSPERFVSAIPDGAGGILLETRPIKGTAPRLGNDRAEAKALSESPKDRAELAMIVDLMRNDLTRVAGSGQVRVTEPGSIMTVANVHHLEARIEARVPPPRAAKLTLGDLLHTLCPGGSITGAPKREVMAAIRSYEERPRGYFMGHAFYLDDSGAFDSSILIRTLVGTRSGYEFAAGSGIVIHSDPAAERREIEAKAEVVTGT